jgi:hypothetical protein
MRGDASTSSLAGSGPLIPLGAAATLAVPVAARVGSGVGIGLLGTSGQLWLSASATIASPTAAVTPSRASVVLRTRSSRPPPRMLCPTENRDHRFPRL